MAKQREPGLPTLAQARAERQSSLVRGRAKLRGELFPHFWLWAAIIIGGSGIIQWKCSADQLAAEKARIMARQRAVAKVLEPKVATTTRRIEDWVRELAGAWKGDVEGTVDLERLGTEPGLYLRMRVVDAAEKQKAFRKAAGQSLQDGFSACFIIQEEAGQDPTAGKACKSASDCTAGEYCNEFEKCRLPPNPFNLRLVYQALRVLSTDWTDRLHETANSKLVRIRDLDLDRVAKENVPIALGIIEKATTLTVVLDEDPARGLPRTKDYTETDAQRVQRMDHLVRVGVYDLEKNVLIGRTRVRANAQLRAVTGSGGDKEHVRATQRQANSCGAALSARNLLGTPASLDRAGSASAGPAGSASAGPAGSASAGPAGSASAGPAGSASAGPAGSASAGPAGRAGPAGSGSAGP